MNSNDFFFFFFFFILKYCSWGKKNLDFHFLGGSTGRERVLPGVARLARPLTVELVCVSLEADRNGDLQGLCSGLHSRRPKEDPKSRERSRSPKSQTCYE